MSTINFMSSREVCDYLGVSVAVLNTLEKSGKLVCSRKLPASNKRLYDADDVYKFKLSVQNKDEDHSNDDSKLLKIGEVAKMLGCSSQTIRNYERSNILVPDEIYPSGHRFYLESTVRKFIDSNMK